MKAAQLDSNALDRVDELLTSIANEINDLESAGRLSSSDTTNLWSAVTELRELVGLPEWR